MRSPNSNRFIVLSVLLHLAAIAIIIIGPKKVLDAIRATPEEVELKPESTALSTETEGPAAAVEPTTVTTAPQENFTPTTKAATPVPPASPKKEIKKKVSVAKPVATKSSIPSSQPEPVNEEKAAVKAQKEKAPVLTKTEPTTEESDSAKTEATSEDAKKAMEPAPAETTQAQVKSEDSSSSEGDLGKGGATKASAVEFTELKQVKGNKTPIYPMAARREHRDGTVELLYRVTKEGRVTDVSVAQSSGHDDLDKAAIKAISGFQYEPGQEGWAKHPITFALKGEAASSPSRLRTKIGAQQQQDE